MDPKTYFSASSWQVSASVMLQDRRPSEERQKVMPIQNGSKVIHKIFKFGSILRKNTSIYFREENQLLRVARESFFFFLYQQSEH